jgi:transposase
VNQILGEEMGDKAGGEESRIDFMNAMNNLKKTVVEEGKWACVACTFQND